MEFDKFARFYFACSKTCLQKRGCQKRSLIYTLVVRLSQTSARADEDNIYIISNDHCSNSNKDPVRHISSSRLVLIVIN